MSRAGFRALFCGAAAVSAAAVADPCIEAASNAGWFGRGNYTDHSMLDVAPALAIAIAFAFLYVFFRARRVLTAPSLTVAHWLRNSDRAVTAKPIGSLLAPIFAAQLGVLYGMETIEQIVVAGHPLGGAVWLGAPIPIAFALHAVTCYIATRLLAHALHALARAAVDVVLFVRSTLLERSNEQPLLHARVDTLPIARRHPLASRSGKRAPPFLFA